MRGKKTKVYGLEGMTKSIFVAFLELYIYYSQHKGCYKCFLRFLLKMKQELKNATLFRIKVVEKEKLVVLWSLLLLRDVFNWLFFFFLNEFAGLHGFVLLLLQCFDGLPAVCWLNGNYSYQQFAMLFLLVWLSWGSMNWSEDRGKKKK